MNPNWIIVNGSIIKSVNQYSHISKEALQAQPIGFYTVKSKTNSAVEFST